MTKSAHDDFQCAARRCFSQTKANNTTLIDVRIIPATMQIGVRAGKKSPLLSRMKATVPASSISPQKPVATAGSSPLDPVGNLRGRSGTGSRRNGPRFSANSWSARSSGMASRRFKGVLVYSGNAFRACRLGDNGVQLMRFVARVFATGHELHIACMLRKRRVQSSQKSG